MSHIFKYAKLALLLIVIGAVLRSLFGEGALFQQHAIERRSDELSSANDSLTQEIERLKGEIELLRNDSLTLEAIARTRLGMSREGEKVYRFIAPETPSPLPSTAE